MHIATNRVWRRIWKYKLVYLMMLPGLLYFVIYKYVPMFGVIIAFKDVSPFDSVQDILQKDWVGFKQFQSFFQSFYFWNVLRNTILLSLYQLLFVFPAPILFALLLNELRNSRFQRVVQTISYLPHFLSIVVIAGLVTIVTTTNGGLVNEIIKLFGGEPIYFLGSKDHFRKVIILSDIWQTVGWGSILYLAAITGIDPEQYDAAEIDGANRLQKALYITLPGMSFIITLLLILNIGQMLDVNFEKILLLYSPPVYEVGDVIDTFVYREGLVSMRYSYASAVGFFKSAVSFVLIIIADRLAKRMGQRGIW